MPALNHEANYLVAICVTVSAEVAEIYSPEDKELTGGLRYTADFCGTASAAQLLGSDQC